MFQLGGKAGLQGAQLGYRERGKVDCRRPLGPVSICLVIQFWIAGVPVRCDVPVPGGAPPGESDIVYVCVGVEEKSELG